MTDPFVGKLTYLRVYSGSLDADYILLDQGAGGTGEPFDWTLVPPVRRPFFLAGGIGPENLRSAIGTLHPWAVDLSSSLETDGRKDRAKIQGCC